MKVLRDLTGWQWLFMLISPTAGAICFWLLTSSIIVGLVVFIVGMVFIIGYLLIGTYIHNRHH